MAFAKICGVNIRIDCDPNARIYYMYVQYHRKKELPILLGTHIDPRKVYRLTKAFFEKEKMKCRPKLINEGIVDLLQNTFKEMGIEDEKTLDLKVFKWKRGSHR